MFLMTYENNSARESFSLAFVFAKVVSHDFFLNVVYRTCLLRVLFKPVRWLGTSISLRHGVFARMSLFPALNVASVGLAKSGSGGWEGAGCCRRRRFVS